jgi:VCBS repeat-containing protein
VSPQQVAEPSADRAAAELLAALFTPRTAGRVLDAGGAAGGIVRVDGTIEAAAAGLPLSSGDIVDAEVGGWVTLRLTDGSLVHLAGGSRIAVESEGGTVTLTVVRGSFAIVDGGSGGDPSTPVLVLETIAGRLVPRTVRLLLEHDGAGGVRFIILANEDGSIGGVWLENDAGAVLFGHAHRMISVAGRAAAPIDGGEIACRHLDEMFPDTAPLVGLDCPPGPALLSLAADQEAFTTEAGGAPASDPGAPSTGRVAVTADVDAFDLAPRPAPLQDPAAFAAPPTAASAPLARHPTEALLQNAVPGVEISLPEPLILRDWDPGRSWEAIGRVDEFGGQIPEVPGASTRLITSRQGDMAMIEASDVSRLQIEKFLGLGEGSLTTLVSGTDPTSGAAIRSLDSIALKAGETVRFDVFFDAASALPFNDFAAMSVLVGGRSLVLPIGSVAEVGGFSASGWQTIAYTAGQAGAYTFGFAVLDDAGIAFSRLFVDNVRRTETSAFTFETLISRSDPLGGTYTLSAPKPIAGADAFVVGEDEVLTLAGEGGLLANDRDPDPFDPLSIAGIDRSATRGRISFRADNSLTYDPDRKFEELAAGQTATDVFRYILDGGSGRTSVGEVRVTVRGINDAPEAVADAIVAVEGGPPVFAAVGANDRDVDSDDDASTLRVVAAVTESGARVEVDSAPGGGIIYHPLAYAPGGLPQGASLTDIVTYTIEDRHGAQATGRVSVLINGVNDDPLARPDALGLDEDSVVTVDVLANDRDPDGTDRLRVTSIESAGTRGIVVPADDGMVVYDARDRFDALSLGETTTDGFAYTVVDGQGATARATVSVLISGRNDAPTVRPDVARAEAGVAAVSVAVLANDDDADSDDDPSTLEVVAASAASGASVSFGGAPGAGIIYVPGTGRFEAIGAGATAVDTVTYTVEDRHGARATSTVRIEIVGVNDPVTADDDEITADEDAPSTIGAPGLLTNDSDPDVGDVLSVVAIERRPIGAGLAIGLPSGARLTTSADGGLVYDPRGAFDVLAPGDSATDSFVYTASDGETFDEGRVTVVVRGMNDAPVAVADTAVVGENGPGIVIPVLTNDTDADRDDDAATLRVTSAGSASEARLSVSRRPGDGIGYDPGGRFEWLGAGDVAVDRVTYTIEDRHGARSLGEVEVRIVGVNDVPVAVADHFNVSAGAVLQLPALLGLLANDSDVDSGDRLRIAAVDGTQAQVGVTITLASGALLTVAADGGITYDPNGRFDGLGLFESAIDSFTYVVADTVGAESTTTARIRVFGDNAPPVAIDDLATTTADAAVRIPVLANDSDPERAQLRISSIDASGTRGEVRIGSDGSITYDPAGRFAVLGPDEIATDRFRYVVDDNIGGRDEATVTVTIRGGRDPDAPPGISAESFEMPFGELVAGWGREPAGGGEPSVRLVQSAAFAGTTFVPTDLDGMVRLDARGSSAVGPGARRSPLEDFLGVRGGTLADDNGRHAGEVGDATEPNAASAIGTRATFGRGDLGGDGRLILSFDWNFLSTEQVGDNQPGRNDYAAFTVTDGTISRFFVLSDSRETGADASGWRTSLYDVTGDFAIGGSGTVALTLGFAVVNDESPERPSSLLIDNVRLNRTLGPDFERIDDGGSGIATYRQRPIARDEEVSDVRITSEDARLSMFATALTENDLPARGGTADGLTVVAVDGSDSRGQVSLANQTIIYDPRGRFDDLAAGESATDSFRYTVRDAGGGTATAVVRVAVTGRNDPPTAVADSVVLAEDAAAIAVDVLANDLDIDGDDGSATLQIVGATTASGARVTVGGTPGATLVYDPGGVFDALSMGEKAVDVVTYTVADRHGATAQGLLTVAVEGANSPPATVDDGIVIDQNTIATLDVLTNDTDADRSDRLTIVRLDQTPAEPGHRIGLPSGATVTVGAAGMLRYDPQQAFAYLKPDERATDRFTYRIDDGHGGSDEAVVTVTILGLSDAPIARFDEVETSEDAPIVVPVAQLLANDFDPDAGPPPRFAGIQTIGTAGIVRLEGDRIVYDPEPAFDRLGDGQAADDTFGYRIVDADGLTVAGEVRVRVLGLNDPPSAVDDLAATTEDRSVRIAVLDNDRDPDAGDRPTVVDVDDRTALGTATLNADGSITYDPGTAFRHLAAGETAADSFTYRISDGRGGFDSANVTVNIAGRADVERIVESFEGAFDVTDRTTSFVGFVSEHRETDGGRTLFLPTDLATMARLEARGSTSLGVTDFLGLLPGALPGDSDGSAASFGSALRVRARLQAGDELSFDWMFDARDFTTAPADGFADNDFADNDFAFVTIADGSTVRLFKLTDVRAVGDQGASGWRSSIFTAATTGDYVIGVGVVNDRSPIPIAENSFLLVDNIRVNREFDEGYQVIQNHGQGTLETLAPITG